MTTPANTLSSPILPVGTDKASFLEAFVELPDVAKLWSRMAQAAQAYEVLLQQGADARAVAAVVGDTFDEHTAAMAALRSAFDRTSGTYVLASVQTGTGKTTAAAYYAGKMGARWINATELGGKGKSLDELHVLIAKAKTCSRLVIDDVGAGASRTEGARDSIEDILLERHNRDLQTVVTTNLNRADFVRFIDRGEDPDESRFLSRVRQTGLSVWLDGLADMRDPEAANRPSGITRCRQVISICERAKVAAREVDEETHKRLIAELFATFPSVSVARVVEQVREMTQQKQRGLAHCYGALKLYPPTGAAPVG